MTKYKDYQCLKCGKKVKWSVSQVFITYEQYSESSVLGSASLCLACHARMLGVFFGARKLGVT